MLIEGVFHSDITQIERYTFEVSGVKTIHFTLLEGAFEHFFVIVKDPYEKIRALFTYKTRLKTYTLSQVYEESDNDTLSGELYDGTWSIEIVRTYPVQGGFKLQVLFDLGVANLVQGNNPLTTPKDKIYQSREGWYQGDFHLHSAYSDGRITLSEVAQSIKETALDFISMSDHSTITTKFPICDTLVIPATEVTWDDEGHYNIHGLCELPDYAYFLKHAKNKNEALDKMFQYFKKKDCVLSINHPFPRGWQLRHNYDIRSFQLLEVINAPHLIDKEVDNEKAIQFFDFLWKSGHRLFAVGGSDAHKKNYYDTYPVAIPETKVYCHGLSIHNVLQSLKLGHTFIQVNEKFELLFHRPNDMKALVLPGSKASGTVLLEARCHHVVQYQLIKNGRIIYESKGTSFQYEIVIRENEYYRLQARTLEGELALFVNPLWNMNEESEVYEFQKILKAFHESYEK